MSQNSGATSRSPLSVKPFTSDFADAAFSCGVKRVDLYFQQGLQLQNEQLARIFVGVERTHPTVPVGYYALHVMHIEVQDLPNDLTAGLRREAIVGAVYVAMLGVGVRYQRRGFGKLLFANALKRSKTIANEAGVKAVVLDALNDDVIPFYNKFGFQPLQHGTNRLFLPITSIP
jgi:GNAT superfamily N-acetyltransferase